MRYIRTGDGVQLLLEWRFMEKGWLWWFLSTLGNDTSDGVGSDSKDESLTETLGTERLGKHGDGGSRSNRSIFLVL